MIGRQARVVIEILANPTKSKGISNKGSYSWVYCVIKITNNYF